MDTDKLTPKSPAVRLYTALHNISGQWLQDEKKLAPYFAEVLPRLAAEHERLVAERLAPVVDERDRWEHDYWQSYAACERLAAAASDRNEVDEKRAALHAEDLSKITAERDAAIAERDRLRDALGYFLTDDRFQVAVGGNPIVVEAMLRTARAALNPEAKS